MPPTIDDPRPDEQARLHPDCVVCSPTNPHGLHLQCQRQPDGSVAARFDPAPWLCGYHGRVHGGVLRLLLDAAMTQCLFEHGITAVTARLHIRYHHPAPDDQRYLITARIEESYHQLYQMSATIEAAGQPIATATARFMEVPAEQAAPTALPRGGG